MAKLPSSACPAVTSLSNVSTIYGCSSLCDRLTSPFLEPPESLNLSYPPAATIPFIVPQEAMIFGGKDKEMKQMAAQGVSSDCYEAWSKTFYGSCSRECPFSNRCNLDTATRSKDTAATQYRATADIHSKRMANPKSCMVNQRWRTGIRSRPSTRIKCPSWSTRRKVGRGASVGRRKCVEE